MNDKINAALGALIAVVLYATLMIFHLAPLTKLSGFGSVAAWAMLIATVIISAVGVYLSAAQLYRALEQKALKDARDWESFMNFTQVTDHAGVTVNGRKIFPPCGLVIGEWSDIIVESGSHGTTVHVREVFNGKKCHALYVYNFDGELLKRTVDGKELELPTEASESPLARLVDRIVAWWRR